MIAQSVTSFISLILVIILYVSIYLWLMELEKNGCECAKLWHYDYIKYMSILLLVTLVFIFLFTIMSLLSKAYNVKIPFFKEILITFGFIYITNSVLVLSYMGILLDYILKLKELQDCKCSEDWKRDYGYYYTIIYFTLIAFLISYFLIAGIYMYNLKK